PCGWRACQRARARARAVPAPGRPPVSGRQVPPGVAICGQNPRQKPTASKRNVVVFGFRKVGSRRGPRRRPITLVAAAVAILIRRRIAAATTAATTTTTTRAAAAAAASLPLEQDVDRHNLRAVTLVAVSIIIAAGAQAAFDEDA